MRTLLVALLLACAADGFAGASAVLVLANYRAAESPVAITVPAEYLAAEVRIDCEEEDWALKLAGIAETRTLLTRAAEQNGFSLRIEQALVFQTSYSKFSFSSSSGARNAVSDVLLLAPLGEQADLVQVVRKFQTLVAGLRPPKKVRVSMGDIALAVADPETHRTELLQKIRAHVEASAKLLTDSTEYHIGGLDEPVRTRQSGEREIELYLPFRVTYSREKAN